MESSIRRKITEHLANPINTECKAVYLLCELRKLYDGQRDGIPFTLQMCIDWALHTELNGKGAQNFLLDVDKFVESHLNGNTDICHEHKTFENFLFIGDFKVALKDFLLSEGIPTEICDEESKWSQFIAAYSGVIEDGSLKYKADAPLKFISEVKFTKGRAISNSDLPFEMSWEIRLRDGRKLISSLSCNSKKGFIFHASELIAAV
jgi:hypothetical protein